VIQHDPNDLGTCLYRAIAVTGQGKGRGYSPNTEPTSFGDALKWFMRAAGGNVSAAARLAGVPRRSMRDYLDGVSSPKDERRRQIAKSAQLSARRERLKPGREARLRRAGSGDVVVIGRYNYDPDRDMREARIGPYLDDDTVSILIDAYLSGASPADLRETLCDHLNDPNGFYQRTMSLPPTDEHGWTVGSVTL
jgi:hypothetical protein